MVRDSGAKTRVTTMIVRRLRAIRFAKAPFKEMDPMLLRLRTDTTVSYHRLSRRNGIPTFPSGVRHDIAVLSLRSG